jgi:hypothetical protein
MIKINFVICCVLKACLIAEYQYSKQIIFLSFQENKVQLERQGDFTTSNEGDVGKEGYLFKRTSNAFKSWVR